METNHCAFDVEPGQTSSEAFLFRTTFKVRRELERCPHCGKPIGRPYGEDEFRYVNDPRNFIGEGETCAKAWEDLVKDYAKAFGLASVGELELKLAAAGF